jgi:hypothetical protein
MERGRPTTFTQEIADELCFQISISSFSLRKICKNLGLDYSTVKRWLIANETFQAQYARAKDEQADHLAEDMLDIADDMENDQSNHGSVIVQRAKLQIDTRKWIASKLKPKKYGDKLDVTSKGESLNKPEWLQ